MSSSQQPSNNNNPAYQNQLLDYENDESMNAARNLQLQTSGHLPDDRGQSYENGLFQPMYPFEEDVDEDLPNEIVAELDARARIQSRVNDDESVFSDVVQDAFRKYQNEYSKYWTYNDTIFDNKFYEEELFDDEQEELYAQMEECWNYMTEETKVGVTPKTSIEQPQSIQLNPDANEFKPSWLKPSSNTPNEGSFVTLPSSHAEEQQKNL